MNANNITCENNEDYEKKDGIFLTEPYTATIGMDTKIVKDSSMKFIS